MLLEKKKITKFDLIKFGNLIAKNSKTQVIIVKNELELCKYFKKNLISDEIIIGMGAGAISKWMVGLKKFFMILTNDLIEKFGSSISKDVKLSNYSWFNLGGNADYFYRAKNKNN